MRYYSFLMFQHSRQYIILILFRIIIPNEEYSSMSKGSCHNEPGNVLMMSI
uniref:ORF50i n=1 Tax=Pinus koraiensis TaxID=88728 RepID=Q85WW8_PINKO|nr:ORF50i [Pinus koraiensis]AAO74101.1 ORF50i [Pinus koraiensis]